MRAVVVLALLVAVPALADEPADSCDRAKRQAERLPALIQAHELEATRAAEALRGVDPTWAPTVAGYRRTIATAEARAAAARQKLEELPPVLQRCQEVQDQAAARLASLRTAPENWQVLRSARLCWYQRSRAEVLAVIAQERRGARIGGVVDLHLLHDAQDAVRRDEDGIATERRELARLRLRPLPCGEQTVSGLAQCLDLTGGFVPEPPPTGVCLPASDGSCAPLSPKAPPRVETNPCLLPPIVDYLAL